MFKLSNGEKASSFICNKNELWELQDKLEKQKEQVLRDLKMFIDADINIEFKTIKNETGFYSIGADLKTFGELTKSYDYAELCFLDLENLMLSLSLKEKNNE